MVFAYIHKVLILGLNLILQILKVLSTISIILTLTFKILSVLGRPTCPAPNHFFARSVGISGGAGSAIRTKNGHALLRALPNMPIGAPDRKAGGIADLERTLTRSEKAANAQ
jgi:hypothetical protein